MPKKSNSDYLTDVMAGLADFRMDNLRISHHAIERSKERGVPLEDLRRKTPKIGIPVVKQNTVVTVLNKGIPRPFYKEAKTFSAKVKCLKTCPFIGHVIGKNGQNIRKIEQLVQFSKIYYDRKEEKFIITSPTSEAAHFFKVFCPRS